MSALQNCIDFSRRQLGGTHDGAIAADQAQQELNALKAVAEAARGFVDHDGDGKSWLDKFADLRTALEALK